MNKNIMLIGLLILTALACRPPVRLNPPFVVISFDEVTLLVEGIRSSEEKLIATEEGLSFIQEEGTGHYRVQGFGNFSVGNLEFNYSSSGLTCSSKGFDDSKGAVVVRRDGSLVSSYLLPLLAR